MNVELRNIKNTPPHHIQKLANNHSIAKNLRDVFPYPYSIKDAENFLELVAKGLVGKVFGIYGDDVFVGVISLIPQTDVYRMNAEIGYWIGEPFWGKGYATEALKLGTQYAFDELNVMRVYAGIFDFNTASMRAVEKAGFKKEAIIESSVIKEGNFCDEHLYSIRKV